MCVTERSWRNISINIFLKYTHSKTFHGISKKLLSNSEIAEQQAKLRPQVA